MPRTAPKRQYFFIIHTQLTERWSVVSGGTKFRADPADGRAIRSDVFERLNFGVIRASAQALYSGMPELKVGRKIIMSFVVHLSYYTQTVRR